MISFFIVLSIGFFIMQTMALRFIKAQTLQSKLLVNGCFSLLAAIMMGIASVFVPNLIRMNTTTVLCGILFGILFAATLLFYNLALNTGPLSYTAFYFSSSMLISALAGIFLFHEKVGTVPYAVVLFLGAFFLLNVSKKEKNAVNKKWILYCIITFLCNGSLAVVQKYHQTKLIGKEASGLVFAGFAFAAVCYALLWMFFKLYSRKNRIKENVSAEIRSNLLPIVLLAVSSLSGNLLLTYLAGRTSASYLYPLVQGSIIVGVTLLSVIFLKEKLSRNGWLGLCFGVAAIVVINL